MKKLIASLLAAALLAAGLAGCGGAPASSGGAAASGAASASSGAADAGIAQQIVVARNKDAALVDPTQTSNATDLMTVAWNFEGLVFPANDGTAIEGALAESWDVSEDGLTYTFHLRDGLKFYNGDAVTAEDILYSLNRAIDPAVIRTRLRASYV